MGQLKHSKTSGFTETKKKYTSFIFMLIAEQSLNSIQIISLRKRCQLGKPVPFLESSYNIFHSP